MYSNPICIPLQFQKNTEHSNFSNSVVDVFTQLTQCFEVLQKLECQDDQIWNRYMKRFAKTVVKVLIAYADVLKNDFPVHVRNEPIVSPSWLQINFPDQFLHVFFVGLCPNEQHPTNPRPIRKDLRIHGWKGLGTRCRTAT